MSNKNKTTKEVVGQPKSAVQDLPNKVESFEYFTGTLVKVETKPSGITVKEVSGRRKDGEKYREVFPFKANKDLSEMIGFNGVLQTIGWQTSDKIIYDSRFPKGKKVEADSRYYSNFNIDILSTGNKDEDDEIVEAMTAHEWNLWTSDNGNFQHPDILHFRLKEQQNQILTESNTEEIDY